MPMYRASPLKRPHSPDLYSDDDYLPSSPGLQPFYPSGPEQEQIPDVDSDGDEEDINEPWAPGLQLRPQTTNTWREWFSPPPDWTDDSSKPVQASWKDQVLLGHMDTCTHNFDAIQEAGWRQLPSAEARSLSKTVQPNRKRARTAFTQQSRSTIRFDTSGAGIRQRDPRRKRRKVLPMVLRGNGQTFNMSACPDSGSDVNVISLTTARSIGCEIKPPKADIASLYLANGQPTEAVGQVAVNCSFAAGSMRQASASCLFQVFDTLAVPLIMGMRFLEETETLSKYHDRLVDELPPTAPAIMVNSVGRSLKSLVCQVNGCNALAVADTGSDLDFISDYYARSRGLTIEEAYHELILADGSLALTSGVACVSFAIGRVDEAGDFISTSHSVEINFYILENLSTDVLIGQDTVMDLNVFTDHAESVIASDPHPGEYINIIRYKGKIEKIAAETWRKMRGVRDDNDDTTSGHGIERVWELEDQRENSRRETKEAAISRLHGEEKAQAEAEETQRVHNYETSKGKRRPEMFQLTDSESNYPLPPCQIPINGPMPPPFSTPTSRTSPYDSPRDRSYHDGTTAGSATSLSFVCSYPGCKAPSFQTQYLLLSHESVHHALRPYFCPVADCPRSDGGKGFRSKNEMIRHSLVHENENPGYVCPFCPDKDHNYPRPENLMRHVRVHHFQRPDLSYS